MLGEPKASENTGLAQPRREWPKELELQGSRGVWKAPSRCIGNNELGETCRREWPEGGLTLCVWERGGRGGWEFEPTLRGSMGDLHDPVASEKLRWVRKINYLNWQTEKKVTMSEWAYNASLLLRQGDARRGRGDEGRGRRRKEERRMKEKDEGTRTVGWKR